MTVRVPSLRLPVGLDPRFQPHVLVVTGETAKERDYEIEHPRDCPRLCPWWPGARESLTLDEGMVDGLPPINVERYDCCVGYWTDDSGLSLLAGEVDGVEYEGWVLGDQWGWRAIPAGRYVIEGWSTPQGWAGSEPVDADGGIVLVGREEE